MVSITYIQLVVLIRRIVGCEEGQSGSIHWLWISNYNRHHLCADACQPEYTISGPLVVTDDGLSVSGMSDPDHDAFDSRLHPIQPDTPPSCWRPPDNPSSPPWIQADLGTVKVLVTTTAVVVVVVISCLVFFLPRWYLKRLSAASLAI